MMFGYGYLVGIVIYVVFNIVVVEMVFGIDVVKFMKDIW